MKRSNLADYFCGIGSWTKLFNLKLERSNLS